LVGQGVHYLNSADKEGNLAYKRVIELLGGQADAMKTIIELYERVPLSDVSLRWTFVYLLGDIADATAADFLTRLATEPLPEQEKQRGCKGPRDQELLVRTMAVEALQRTASRHAEAVDDLLRVVSERPARPILIEAVKAAIHLGLKEKVRRLLPEEEHWILDIRKARIEDIHADPERSDGKERGFTPPNRSAGSIIPRVHCHSDKQED
jgi:HEAT repeat protein